jgi:hypothetical protein
MPNTMRPTPRMKIAAVARRPAPRDTDEDVLEVITATSLAKYLGNFKSDSKYAGNTRWETHRRIAQPLMAPRPANCDGARAKLNARLADRETESPTLRGLNQFTPDDCNAPQASCAPEPGMLPFATQQTLNVVCLNIPSSQSLSRRSRSFNPEKKAPPTSA